MTASSDGSNGQQLDLWSEQPTAGYSVIVLSRPVARAKYGTVQPPVSRAWPVYDAVVVADAVGITVSITTFPAIVLTPVTTDEELVVVVEEERDKDVLADAVAEVVALAEASALERPDGEHPTKSGAVSLTAAHSCWLNWMAARNEDQPFCSKK